MCSPHVSLFLMLYDYRQLQDAEMPSGEAPNLVRIIYTLIGIELLSPFTNSKIQHPHWIEYSTPSLTRKFSTLTNTKMDRERLGFPNGIWTSICKHYKKYLKKHLCFLLTVQIEELYSSLSYDQKYNTWKHHSTTTICPRYCDIQFVLKTSLFLTHLKMDELFFI